MYHLNKDHHTILPYFIPLGSSCCFSIFLLFWVHLAFYLVFVLSVLHVPPPFLCFFGKESNQMTISQFFIHSTVESSIKYISSSVLHSPCTHCYFYHHVHQLCVVFPQNPWYHHMELLTLKLPTITHVCAAQFESWIDIKLVLMKHLWVNVKCNKCTNGYASHGEANTFNYSCHSYSPDTWQWQLLITAQQAAQILPWD